jgi:TonB-linked SusC/RagA family outer membrane protein
MQVSANGYGQNRISVNLRSVGLTKALSTIEKKSNYRFLYNQSLVSSFDKVQLIADNEEVTSVLNRLFANTNISYRILANNLVVLKTRDKPVIETTVSGKVVSPTGEPIAGVSVTVKGSTAGTSTDAEGNFTITVPDDATLVFSSVGFADQEVKVSGQTTINVTMAEATGRTMDEVVVIGYGTASKRDLTGSIVKVAGREVADKPNTNPLASLQGRVSGVSIVNSGRPGQEPDIRIRGTISRFQTKPLYVVDGLFSDNIDFVNPADIESMEVLKDASSLAIFGVRGANGVIIVTTKRGKTGAPTINFNTTYGIKRIVDKVSMVDAAGFKELFDEQRANEGAAPFSFYDLFTGNTNWVDLIANDNASITQNNLSISSGTDRNKFYMGIGYQREEGLIKYEKYDKITLSVNDEYRAGKGIKVGFNLNGMRIRPTQERDFTAAINATPIVEAFNQEKGVYNKLPDEIGGPQIGNPLMGVEGTRNTNRTLVNRLAGSVFAEISFLKTLTFRSNFYGDLGFADNRGYTPIIDVYAAESDEIARQVGFQNTSVFQSKVDFRRYQQEYLLTFKKDYGEHGLTLLGGFTTFYTSYSETNGRVTQRQNGDPIPNDPRWWYLDNFPYGDPETRVSGISPGNDVLGNPRPLQWENSTVSYLARALYNFQGKYMLNLSFRRDGSSEISPANRYQNFIAAGAAWEVSREEFMTKQNIFDFLKVKASWGILGNQVTGINYPYYPQLIQGSSAVFGNNIVAAYRPAYLADQDLKWETVTSVEGGFEAALLNNRLFFEAVYFNKLTDDLLTNFGGIGGVLPGITNAGKIRNTGVEASATWSDKITDKLSYSVSGNITTTKNKVLELYQQDFTILEGAASRTIEGYPIGHFFGYEVAGVYQSATEKAGSPDASALGEYGAGDLKFRDVNGDGAITTDDRVVIGNPTPDFIYGLSLGASYGAFQLSVDMQGVYGNEIFRAWGNGNTFAVFNFRTDRLGRWNGPGTSNWEPQLNDTRGINKVASTYMIEDGSYFRIRNLQLAYNLPSAIANKIAMRNARVFLNAQNLKTFKNNTGFTPEFGGSAVQFGVDQGSYPLPAIFSAGINVTF